MGIIGFLKSIFANGQGKVQEAITESKEESVSMEKLEGWFAQKESAILKASEVFLSQQRSKLSGSAERCESSLVELKNAQPRYPELYNQNKTVAEGNRASFIVNTENFLRAVRNIPDSASQINEYIPDFDSAMKELALATGKSFIITKEIFTEETFRVREIIQEIDKTMSEIKKHSQESGLAQIHSARAQIAKLAKAVQQSRQLEKELKEADSNMSKLQEQRRSVENEQTALLQNPEFLEKQKLELDLTAQKARIKAQENELYGIFADLDTPLRKLAWGNPDYNKLVNKYLHNLISALKEDKDFKFEKVLDELKLSIESGSVQMNDKKRVTALKNISKISKGYLQAWLLSYEKETSRELELRDQIENSPATRQELEIKDKLQKLDEKLEQLEKQKTSITKVQKRTNINDELLKTNTSLQDLAGHKVSVQI